MKMMRINTAVKKRVMGHHRGRKCENKSHREGEAMNMTAGGSPL